jgi:hypothetical protein
MAKIEPRNGNYHLDDPKDTELEGIDDKKYNVSTEHTKLDEAKRNYHHINWFVSYTIKDKDGNDVQNLDKEYTIKLDKPDSEKFELYYYLGGTAYPFQYEDTDLKENKKRVKAKLIVGDPPVGSVP